MNARQALCVGINQFAHLPRSSWLNGCVNDADDMAALLRDEYGYPAGDVAVLTDRKATKAAVMDRLTDLVDHAVAGHVEHLVISYSSHGTQVPDLSGDEPDRVDEALAAYDIRSDGDAWDPDSVLVDDELHALLGRVPSEVNIEVFLDTCHSGTGLRAIDLLPGRTPRFVPPPTPAGLDAVADRDSIGLVDLTAVRRAEGSTGPVLFAACRSDQTAADARFAGRSNGAFTHFLIRALRATGTRSRAVVLKDVRAGLRAGRFGQSPQLEASAAAKRRPVGQPG